MVVIPTDMGLIKDFLLVSLGLPDPINDSTIFSWLLNFSTSEADKFDFSRKNRI